MAVFSSLFGALGWLVHAVLVGLLWIVIINALLSWVRPDPGNPIVVFLDRVSGMLCDPIRRLVPTVAAGLDFAPLIVVLLLGFLDRFLGGLLARLAGPGSLP